MFVRDAEKKRLHLVYFEQISPKTQPFFFNRLFVLTVVVEKTKEAFPKIEKLKVTTQNFIFFRGMVNIVSFLLQNMFKNRNFVLKIRNIQNL